MFNLISSNSRIMLKAFIIEDEIKAVQLLETYINKIDFLELLGYTHNPISAVSILKSKKIDVLFLDINLPSVTGIDLLKSIKDPPDVIFTTAYSHFAVEGFTLDAIDYLLKPISFPRFLKACQKLLKSHDSKSPVLKEGSQEYFDIFYLKSGSASYKVSWKKVLYLEKDENYVIYRVGKQKILSRQILRDLEDTLPIYMFRVHKTFIVSLLHTTKMEGDILFIEAIEIPIGRTYKKALLQRLKLLSELRIRTIL